MICLYCKGSAFYLNRNMNNGTLKVNFGIQKNNLKIYAEICH